MANVILSESSNNANSLFGEVQGPIKAFIERRDEAWMKQEDNLAAKIFKKSTSNHRSEGYGGLTAIDAFNPVGENGAYTIGSTEEGYMKWLVNETWKGSFSISRELMDDKMEAILKGKPTIFMDDYHRKVYNFLFALLGSAVQNKDKCTFGGKDFDITCADGAKLFSQTHKEKISGKNQTNAFKDKFSAKSLGLVATHMQNFRDDNHNMLTLTPDTIIIPNEESIKAEVFGVIGAYHDPTTAAGNKFNYQFGNWNVFVCKELNDFCSNDTTSGLPYILFDSKYNQTYDCAIHQERVPLEVRSEIDQNTDANIWKGYARFTGGFVDWRAFAIGGVSFGATA